MRNQLNRSDVSEIERSVDEAGSTTVSHARSHGKPVVRLVLPVKLIHEQDVDPLSEVSSLVVYRELKSELLSLLSSL